MTAWQLPESPDTSDIYWHLYDGWFYEIGGNDNQDNNIEQN